MKQKFNALHIITFIFGVLFSTNCIAAIEDNLVTKEILRFGKAEFDIKINSKFENPYDSRIAQLDMIIKAPSGKELVLPCYYDKDSDAGSLWKARFAPSESGNYKYHFRLTKKGSNIENSKEKTFITKDSQSEGFLRLNNYWTLKFDSGKPFRGIGENIASNPRTKTAKYTYSYLLPKISANGANFIRIWMDQASLPKEWYVPRRRPNEVTPPETEIKTNQLDETIEIAEKNGIYIMVALDIHGMLIDGSSWSGNAFNAVNGGPAKTPAEFFTLEESKIKYKNKLRYFVARWGYSTHIAFWEFFNEVDNAMFGTSQNKPAVPMPHKIVTDWHREMSDYLKSIDPYKHLVTTSISHREIDGLNDLPSIDLNQKHIYKRTSAMRPETIEGAYKHGKPYAIGEFGYEWDWNLNFASIAVEKVFDFKRGLWYGMFTPTPILPMSWWWEYFDDRGVTPYFNGVRDISDQMLAAGNGVFDTISVKGNIVESYAVKCGEKYFVYILNNSNCDAKTDITLSNLTNDDRKYSVNTYIPDIFNYNEVKNTNIADGTMIVNDIYLRSKDEIVLIISPLKQK